MGSVGPKQGGMAPRGFMMGGMRQGTTIKRDQFPSGTQGDAAYKKALAAEAADEERFFGKVGRNISWG
jgi:hypothetical protein